MAPVRRVVTAGASVLVGAGAAVGAFAALHRQGDAAGQAITQAAIDAAREQGLLDDLPSTQELLATALPVPRADGVYAPDGSLLAGSFLADPGGTDGNEAAGGTGGTHRTGGSGTAAPGGIDKTSGDAAPGALTLVMLGDSTAVGFGCRTTDELPAVRLARGLAAARDRPVRVWTRGRVGAITADLQDQVATALADDPDVVVINIGANDLRDQIPPHVSARALGAAVAALTARHVPVVVGTCPDFGVIAPIPQPLRTVLHLWSRTLAGLQIRATRAAGGRAVDIGRQVSPEFAGHPAYFAPDGFHPSGLGYGTAVAALLPAVLSALSDAAVSDAAVSDAAVSDAALSDDTVSDFTTNGDRAGT